MTLTVVVKAIILSFAALIFGHFSIKNANESSIQFRGYDLSRGAKIGYIISIILIVLIDLIFSKAWGFFVLLMIGLGVLQILNQEGFERRDSWNNLAFLVFLAGLYAFAAQLDVEGALNNLDPSRLNFTPLLMLIFATVFEIVAGLIKVKILEREDDEESEKESKTKRTKSDKKDKKSKKADRKATIIAVVLTVILALVFISVCVWAFS